MKKWSELTPDQRHKAIHAIDYLLSDRWWIDMIDQYPEVVHADLIKHGYDPDTMTLEEKIAALNAIPAD